MRALLPQAARLGTLLKARKETVAVAESAAGGLVSAALLAAPGASAYFIGGAVVYTAAARAGLLGITEEDMRNMRPSSPAYASLLAERTRQRFGTTWSIAESGAAGPTGNRYGDPAGHACLAVAGPVALEHTLRTGQDGREENMLAFAAALLSLLENAIARAEE